MAFNSTSSEDLDLQLRPKPNPTEGLLEKLPIELVTKICEFYYEPWKAKFDIDSHTNALPGINLLLVNKLIMEIAKPFSDASYDSATMRQIQNCNEQHFAWAKSRLRSITLNSDEGLLEWVLIAGCRQLSVINIQNPFAADTNAEKGIPETELMAKWDDLFTRSEDLSKNWLRTLKNKAGIFEALPKLEVNKRLSYDLRYKGQQLHSLVHTVDEVEINAAYHTSKNFFFHKTGMPMKQTVEFDGLTDKARRAQIPDEWIWALDVDVIPALASLHRAYTDVITARMCERLADKKIGHRGLGRFCSRHCHKADSEENTLRKAKILQEARLSREDE